MFYGNQVMKILIDADGCPVVNIVEKIAKEYSVPCELYCDEYIIRKH